MGSEIKNRQAARERHLSQCHSSLFRHESSYFPNIEVRTGKLLEYEIALCLFLLALTMASVLTMCFSETRISKHEIRNKFELPKPENDQDEKARFEFVLFEHLVFVSEFGLRVSSLGRERKEYSESPLPLFVRRRYAKEVQ